MGCCFFFPTEFDEDLDGIERKITNIAGAAKTASKKTKFDNIVVSKVVGFFVSDWNKWIRCIVKAKNTNGTIYLWSPDYGLPFTGIESQIIVIPSSFQGMAIKYKVHLGGIINLVPGALDFDFSTGNVETKMSKSWSTTASEELGEVLKTSLALEFKDIHLHYPMQKPHFFGRLMIQLANGTWHNAIKCLINLRCAIVSHDNWDDILKKHDSYHQEIWRTKDGTPLSYTTSVIPIKCDVNVEEIDDVENVLDCRLSVADQEPADDCLSRVEIDELTLEDQQILDTSASLIGIGYGGKRPQNNRKRIDTNSRAAKNRYGVPNYPAVKQAAIINGPAANTSRNSNEFVGRVNRNTNIFRHNDNNYNNNNNYYRPENRPDNRHIQGFEYGKPFPGPSGGSFRPLEAQGRYQAGYQGENQGYPDRINNDQQRQARTPRPGNNYNRSGQSERRKHAKNNSNFLGRLEQINENSSGVKENVEKQNENVEKAVEDQNKNVKKPVEKEIETSDVRKDINYGATENVNVPASDSATGNSTIKSDE